MAVFIIIISSIISAILGIILGISIGETKEYNKQRAKSADECNKRFEKEVLMSEVREIIVEEINKYINNKKVKRK